MIHHIDPVYYTVEISLIPAFAGIFTSTLLVRHKPHFRYFTSPSVAFGFDQHLFDQLFLFLKNE